MAIFPVLQKHMQQALESYADYFSKNAKIEEENILTLDNHYRLTG